MPYTRPPLSKELLAGDAHGGRSARSRPTRSTPSGASAPRRRRSTASTRVVVLADGDDARLRPADRRDRLPRPHVARRRRRPARRARPARPRRRARAARRAFDERPRLAIVGGGFVGCEVAATARKHGLDVTRRRRRAAADGAARPGARRPLRRPAPRARRRPAPGHRRRRAGRHGPRRGHRARRRVARGRRRRRGRARRDPEHRVAAGQRARPRARPRLRRDADLARATPTSSAPATSSPGRTRWPTASACASSTGPSPPSTGGSPAATPSPPRTSAPRTWRRPTSGRTSTTSRSRPSASRPAPTGSRSLESSPDGERFVAVGARDGRVVGVDRLQRRQAARAGTAAGWRTPRPRSTPCATRCSPTTRCSARRRGRCGEPGARPRARRRRAARAARRTGRPTRGIALDVRHAGDPLPAAQRPGVRRLARLRPQPERHARAEGRRASCASSSEAVRRDVPVLGLCFGGQMLAKVLGGAIEPAPTRRDRLARDRDRRRRTSSRRSLAAVALRPLHAPARRRAARELAAPPCRPSRTGATSGVQFHPESTIEIVRGWAAADEERLVALGIEDGEALPGTGPPPRRAGRPCGLRPVRRLPQRTRR